MAKYTVYLGTYSKGEGNGLFRGEFDSESGEIKINDTLDIENPSYLQLSDNILYGVSEVGSFENEKGGALFSVDISDNKQMRLIDMKCTHGRSPCHLCVSDKMIFVSNYSEGSLSIFEIGEAGSIKPSYQSIHHFGKGVNPGRQEASHIHFANRLFGKYIAVCDLGLDKVFLYPDYHSSHNNMRGLITNAEIIECPPGRGPRHFAQSAMNSRYLYVLTEMGNTVLVYKFNDDLDVDKVELIQEITTLPDGFTGKSTAAAIHVSPDGKLLGASNRGADCITLFKMQDDGKLALSRYIADCKEPRDFRFSPDGKWLLTANQNGNTVSVFEIKTGNNNMRKDTAVPKPVCILFGEEIK